MPTHIQAKHTPAPTAAPPAASQFAARPFEEESEQIEEQVPETKSFAGGSDTPPSEPTPPPADGGSVLPAGDAPPPSSGMNFLDMPLSAEEAGVQTKLTIGEPGDKYEREADQTAAQVMRMPDPQVEDPLEAEVGAPQIQQRGNGGDTNSIAHLQSRLNHQSGKGAPLPKTVQSFMEPRFGHDFSQVRVHTDSSAVQMNKDLGAQAFTHGNDIYFNQGKYNPGSSSGQELLAHELTHTVQQTGGVQFKPEEPQAQAEPPDIQQKTKGSHFLWRMVQTKMGMLSPKAETGSPDVQAKCNQCEAEEKVQRQPISSVEPGTETVQAEGLPFSIPGPVDDYVGEFVGNIVDVGWDLLEQRAPELADLIRQGPVEMLKETVGEGIRDWFNGLLEELGISDIVEDFTSSFNNLFDTVRLVMEGDPETCNAVAEKLNSMSEFVKGVMDNPKVKALQDAFAETNEMFQQILDTFVAPVFNTVMDLVGDGFQAITDFGRQIWEWSQPVRDALKEAWDWVMEQLGIGGGEGDSEGGLIDWVKEKAGEAWESIKETLGPVIEPIRTVVMVAAALNPITWIAAAVKYAPQVIDMVKWLWANRDNPNIVESAHEEMGHTILPQLLSGLQGFGDGLEGAVNTFIDEVTKISDSLISLISSLTGLPLLNMIEGTIETISNGIKDFINWSRDTFKSVSKSVVEFARKIQEKIRPWIDVLVSIAGVLLNPAGISGLLLGQAWMALPDCYKGPIIDFLLETLIEILGGMPEFPFFGILWPFLKQGVLGFLQGLLAQSTDVKVAISNKIAKIIGGGSPDFVLGFVRGFLRGLWEGLTDPFALIYDGIMAINDFKDWLNRSEEEGRTQADNQRDTATDQASDSPRQTDTTTQDDDTNSPGRRGASPLQDAGMNILEIIIDRLITMAGELEAPSNEVTTNFLSAAQEIFSSAGEDITFEDVMDMMGEVQGQVMTAIGEAGGQIANQVCEFMMQDEAESKIGDGAGWLAGTIVLELVLAYFTAGASIAAKGAIKAARMITNVMDRSGPAMRMASSGMKTLGRHIDEILESVRKLLSKAGDKASTVMDNMGVVGDILRDYGDEFLELLMGGVPVPGGGRGRDRDRETDTYNDVPDRDRSRDEAESSPEPDRVPDGDHTSDHDRASDPDHIPDQDRRPEPNLTPDSHRTPDREGTPPRTPDADSPDRMRDRSPDNDQSPTPPPRKREDRDDEGLTEDDRRFHRRLAREAISELEEVAIDDYNTVRQKTQGKARRIEYDYTRRLKRGIKLRVNFEDSDKDKQNDKLDFEVVIAPNNAELDGDNAFVPDDCPIQVGDKVKKMSQNGTWLHGEITKFEEHSAFGVLVIARFSDTKRSDTEKRKSSHKKSLEKVVEDFDNPNPRQGCWKPDDDDQEHELFVPKELIKVEPTQDGAIRAIQYKTHRNALFRVEFNSGDLVKYVKAEHLELKNNTGVAGRGKTRRSPGYVENEKLNASHLIADQFLGSGYKESSNLITTSANFNNPIMKNIEDAIVVFIIENDAKEFDMELTITWGELETQEVIDKIMKELPDRSKNDVLREVQAFVARAKPQFKRCMNVNYKVVVLNEETGNQERFQDDTGPDAWIGLI